MAKKGKKPLEKVREIVEEERSNMEKEEVEDKIRENSNTRNKEEEDKKKHETKETKQKGPCKPKAEITLRVILNDPTLKVHREHMQTYATICKFMGL